MIDPSFVPPEHRNTATVEVIRTHEYTNRDRANDALAAVLLFGALFVITWIAFGLDVITTGM
jgi:hypothetical protein